MITDLWIENFKGIGKRQHIPLRPVTLLFGANSAGKSTVLHALEYLRQVVVDRKLDGYEAYGPVMATNLGGIENLFHRDASGVCHNTQIVVGVQLELVDDELAQIGGFPRTASLNAVKTFRAEFSIGRYDPGNSVDCSHIRISLNGEEFIHFTAGNYNEEHDLEECDARLFTSHPLLKEVDGREFWMGQAVDLTLISHFDIDLLGPGGGCHVANMDIPRLLKSVDAGGVKISKLQMANEMTIADVVQLGWSALSHRLMGLTHIGAKRATVPRWLNSKVRWPDANWHDGSAAWNWLLRASPAAVRSVKSWMGTDRLNLGYTIQRDEWFEISSEIRNELINLGDESPPIELLVRLTRAPEVRSLFLLESRSNRSLHPQDVGEGITQVLPIIAGVICKHFEVEPRLLSDLGYGQDDHPQDHSVYDLEEVFAVDENRTAATSSRESPVASSTWANHFAGLALVAIEQPELHLHPAVAARLGDLFVVATDELKGATILAETHSEHIILRLLRRIRQTTDGELPEHIPPVKPDDVCVLYVDNLGDGTIIKRLRINEDGGFIDRWPHGFFSERTEELY